MNRSVISRVPVTLEPPSYVELVVSLIVVWGFADTLSTVVAMRVSGSAAAEVNPWIRTLLIHEPLLVVALKGAVVLYVGVVLVVCQDVVETVPGWRLWFLGVIGTGTVVVCQNLAFVAATL
ncbi:MAG: hypothetical protein ABEI98_05095 [Halorhabdus sp.]